jgi:DNA-binding GntR family transcriptional regulator
MSRVASSGRQVVRHEVRERLQQMILNGEQRSGSKLVQQALAKRFGVAQGVVREALLELQAYGLVETIDNRGVFVSELNVKVLLDSLSVRELHEGLAVRQCCGQIAPPELQDWEQISEQIYTHSLNGQLEEMARLDRELHHRIVKASDNRVLVRLAENVRILGKVVRVNRDARQVRAEHLAIIQAIRENRPDDAERVMRSHIAVARQLIQDQLKGGTFIPHWVVG